MLELSSTPFIRQSKSYAALATFLLACTSSAHSEKTILQYFGTSWEEIEKRIPEVAEAGYTHPHGGVKENPHRNRRRYFRSRA